MVGDKEKGSAKYEGGPEGNVKNELLFIAIWLAAQPMHHIGNYCAPKKKQLVRSKVPLRECACQQKAHLGNFAYSSCQARGETGGCVFALVAWLAQELLREEEQQ